MDTPTNHTAEEVEEWDLPPIITSDEDDSLHPDYREEEPEIDWLEHARLIPPGNYDCPVRIPARPGRRAQPLLLTFPKIAMYHRMIDFTGEDDSDKPQGLDDCLALLFLSSHEPRTWNTALSAGNGLLPLRASMIAMWAATDAWAEKTFGTSLKETRLAMLIARRLWEYHAGDRPIAEKKTTAPTMTAQSGHPLKTSSHGSSPEETSPDGENSTGCPSGTFMPPSTATGASTESQ